MLTTITKLSGFLGSLLGQIRHRWIHLTKIAGDLTDFVKPKGYVEIVARHAHGPRKGEVAWRKRGRNIITSQLSSTYSGRDIIRRIIVDSALSGSLAGSISDHTFKYLRLGSGTTAETVNDTALVTPISGSLKAFTGATFDGSNTYVTLSVSYDETEVNTTIAELSIESENGDFIARKTIPAFTKTTDFTIEVRWQIRV